MSKTFRFTYNTAEKKIGIAEVEVEHARRFCPNEVAAVEVAQRNFISALELDVERVIDTAGKELADRMMDLRQALVAAGQLQMIPPASL